jgi:O-antigen/teichoic acid export membrane protein
MNEKIISESVVSEDLQVQLTPAEEPANLEKENLTPFQIHFKRLCDYLGVHGFIKDVIIVVGGTVLGQLLTIFATPIITHLYTPHDFGLASVYGSILSFIAIIGCWCFELAIPLPKEDETAIWLSIISTLIVFIMAIITAVVVFVWGGTFCELMKAPDLAKYIFLLPVSLCAVCFYQILSFWVIRWQSYGLLARTKISQSIGQITVQIGAGLLSNGPMGLLIGDVIGRSSGAVTLGKQLWRKRVPSFNIFSWTKLAEAAYRYRRFPLISSWSGLLNGLGWMYPPIVTYFYGTQVVGWLALCSTIIGTPLSLVSVSVGKVYYGESAKITKIDAKTQMLLFQKTVKKLMIVIVPAVIIATLIAPWLIPKLFGSQWAPIVLYMQVLLPSYIFMAISSPMFSVLDVYERQDMHLVRECMRIPMMLGPFMICGIMGYSALVSIIIYSISTSLFYLINVILAWRIIKVE